MATITYSIDKSELDKLSLGITEAALKQATQQACAMVEAKAKMLCPVDTGQLRGSITYDVNQVGPMHYEGTVGTNVEYAPYVEFGTGLFAANGDGRKDVPWSYQTADGKWHSTVGQHPQPFLMPAFQQCKDDIDGLVKEAIRKGVQQ